MHALYQEVVLKIEQREVIYLDIDPNDRNPIYPNALRLCDVADGVSFKRINLLHGELESGRFVGEPYYSSRFEGELAIRFETRDKKFCFTPGGEILLSVVGIIRRYKSGGIWSDSDFTVINNFAENELYKKWLYNGGQKIVNDIAGKLWEISRKFDESIKFDDQNEEEEED